MQSGSGPVMMMMPKMMIIINITVMVMMLNPQKNDRFFYAALLYADQLQLRYMHLVINCKRLSAEQLIIRY